MKFGKSLSTQIEETLPEWRDKFLSYKELKKRLKRIAVGDQARPVKRPKLRDEDEPAAIATEEEEDFLKLLEAEMEKFNAFFVEKEEEYIIRQKELQDLMGRVAGKGAKEELMKVRKEIVDLHGELVLLENYSALNYTGLVKILKKYDKRTGALIRLPFIQKVLQQPFFTTDLIYKLVKDCETMLEQLFSQNEQCVSGDVDGGVEEEKKKTKKGSSSFGNGLVPELEEKEIMESMYVKSTVAALRVLKEIRSGSSTVSVFSLPPLQTTVLEKRWDSNNIPVLEQIAK